MHESKQKQLAIHERSRMERFRAKLNIEPLSFPEKGSSVMKQFQLQTISSKRYKFA